jgi:hypothetical protein
MDSNGHLKLIDMICRVSSGEIQIDDSNVGLLGNGITTMSWNGEVLTDGSPNKHEFAERWKV